MAWHGKVRPGLLLFLFSFVVISEATAKSIEQLYRYDTAYACEGKTLKIECKEGELIKLIRANYGRFSITICNDHGNTDWSVNCMSSKSLRVLHGRCTHHQNCSIPASTSMFGDPCPGTHKYLEAHYQCLPATTTTTTSRPSPPWLITSPPMWSTVKPSARPPPPPPKAPSGASQKPPTSALSTAATTTTTTASSAIPAANDDQEKFDEGDIDEEDHMKPIPDEITTLPYTTIAAAKKSTPEITYSTYVPPSSVLPSWTKEVELANYCTPTTVRSINWNWTKIDAIDIQPCPGGTTGFARWKCASINNTPNWQPQTPDLSQCRSVWLTSLEQRIIVGKEALASISSELDQVTSSNKLYGGDIKMTTQMIQKMAEKMAQHIQTFPDSRRREEIVTEMLNDVVKTGSNLLDASQHASWKDLSYKEQMRVATSLLIGLEEYAFLLADTVMKEKTVDQFVKNIKLSVRVLETKSITSEVLFPSDDKWSASNDSIQLSRGALQENSDGGLVRLVFVAFDRLEEILQWQPDTEANKNVTRMLNSKVISASLGKGRHIQLSEPVRLTLRHLQVENVSNPSCVFWDYTTNAWLEEGCHVAATNRSHTVCQCNHLTNFAILMDVHAIYLPIPHQIALKIVTYVGCIISIVCLILAIVTFQLFRGLKSDRTTIHCNLCICLLIAELIFLIGIGQTENQIVCSVIAGFLQYFFLCAFIWMFLEGFQLYVMLIEVFEAEKSRVRWYYCFAYGLPFLIVLISATIYPRGYGTEQHCWLKTNNYFIYSFVGPVIVVLLLNLVFLAMAVGMMCRHASTSVSLKNKEHSRLASTSGKEENALQNKIQAHLAWLKGAIVLVFLLGLTWTFGFLYINEESVAMAYVFALLNTLQGFFIFLFHCVQNEKVRKEYRKFIRRHNWLPKCLRCSKPSGGAGSSSGGSSGPNKERRTSIYGGSNGNNPSGTNTHSTDNSALSPHGIGNSSTSTTTATTTLQRDWNTSRSCTNVPRGPFGGGLKAGVGVVGTATSNTVSSTAATMSLRSTPPPPPPPQTAHLDAMTNTSTLPYIRNFYKNNPNLTPNMPKSASTWGPLHKPLHWKNISFKSYSRDSGHGGSEQEESPRSQQIMDGRNAKDGRRQGYVADQAIIENDTLFYQDYGRRPDMIPHPKHLPLPQSLQSHGVRKKSGGCGGGTLSKTNNWTHHTYTEIYDRSTRVHDDDPVYEEIERNNEIQVSDMSDEDGKRQSDMSRQSSRSYGDHRPLIPYSPGTDRNIVESGKKPDEAAYRMRANLYRGDPVRSLAAVLDGETVVCHLEPPDMYARDPYNSRTLVLPPYSES